MCIEETSHRRKKIEQKRIQLKNDNPDADGEKTEKVDEPLHGAGTDRNGWSNDRIRTGDPLSVINNLSTFIFL